MTRFYLKAFCRKESSSASPSGPTLSSFKLKAAKPSPVHSSSGYLRSHDHDHKQPRNALRAQLFAEGDELSHSDTNGENNIQEEEERRSQSPNDTPSYSLLEDEDFKVYEEPDYERYQREMPQWFRLSESAANLGALGSFSLSPLPPLIATGIVQLRKSEKSAIPGVPVERAQMFSKASLARNFKTSSSLKCSSGTAQAGSQFQCRVYKACTSNGNSDVNLM
eukprot:g4967.t1